MFLAPRRPMMGFGMLGGSAYTASRVRQNQAEAAARAAPPPPPPPPAPPAEPALSPLVANLQAVEALRESGILTEEEFQTVKRRLLEA
jgi:hypothetical protein